MKDGKWNMRGAMIGFKALSGVHDGENLGRYMYSGITGMC